MHGRRQAAFGTLRNGMAWWDGLEGGGGDERNGECARKEKKKNDRWSRAAGAGPIPATPLRFFLRAQLSFAFLLLQLQLPLQLAAGVGAGRNTVAA